MKRVGLITMVLMIVISASMLVGCSQSKSVSSTADSNVQGASEQPKQKSKVPDGTYNGVAMGNNGPIHVSVDLKDDKIVKVEVVRSNETLGLTDAALSEVPQAIVDNNSVNVNAVSGATFTSVGIMTAVQDALKKAGADIMQYQSKQPSPKPTGEAIRKSCDIVIVGGGGAGLTAAVKATEATPNVILLEKMPSVGGVTQLNSGNIITTGSRLQSEVLEEENDSPDLVVADTLAAGHDKNDTKLVRLLAENAGRIFDWLVDEVKIKYSKTGVLFDGHSVARQMETDGKSVNFVKEMERKFKAQGGTVMLNTRAQEFLMKDDKVVGVRAVNEAGDPVFIEAKSVILATGGFGANKELLPKEVQDYLFYGLDSETGDGLKMGQRIGAATINLDLVNLYPNGVEVRPGRTNSLTVSSTATTRGSGSLYVNREGKRFVDENTGLYELTQATREQTDHMAYLVMDAAGFDIYKQVSIEKWLVSGESEFNRWLKIKNDNKPIMTMADTLEAVADAMGIDEQALVQEVNHYNKMAQKGVDKDFGKQDPLPLGEGPYVILEQKIRYETTLGGLKANENLQILNKDDKPIKNLYGAGNVVGGVHGDNSLSAMLNSWATMSGFMAAEQAVANLQQDDAK